MKFEGLKYLVVGSGLCGSVIASCIARELDEKVAVIERRNHHGGNCFSETDRETGIEIHKYGTHVFHTADRRVWDYICRFASFNHYRHRVFTVHGKTVFPMPINLETVNKFFGINLDPEGMRRFLERKTAAEHYPSPANLEEQAVALAGKELYEAFIKGYTKKQWNVDPARLPAEIIRRLPFRYSYCSDYFDDPFQGLPKEGYGTLFSNLLMHRNIDLYLSTDFFDIRTEIPHNCRIVFTGAIDRYFDYRFGPLGWRSLSFEKESVDVGDFQGTSVMNYADEEIPFTRIHEFRHLHPERRYQKQKTVIAREFSINGTGQDLDPCYPINTASETEVYHRYQKLAAKLDNVIFCGRLGSFSYLDMDRAIRQGLDIFDKWIKKPKT